MYSRSTFLTDSFSLEKQEELKKIRVITISAAISYLVWWALMRYLSPGAYDPLWQRIMLSSISIVFFAASYVTKDFLKHTKYVYLLAWLYSYHLLFLYWKNADNAFYIICNIIQFPYIVLSFPTLRMAQIYTYVKIAVVILISFFVSYLSITPWFIVLTYITMGHYLMVASIRHFNVLNGLKRSHKSFELTLSNMHEGVVVIDDKEKIVTYNPTAEYLLNFFNGNEIGKSYKETNLFTHTRQENLLPFSIDHHPLELSFKDKKAFKNKIMSFGLNGEHQRWLQVNIQPLEIGEADHILVTFADFSQLKLQQQRESLEHATLAMSGRLSSLFTVSSGIAHEINNPLVIISANLHLLKRKMEQASQDNESVKEIFEKISRAVKRITGIVDGLKSLSRSDEQSSYEIVSASELIQSTLELTKETIKQRNIELIVDDIPEVQFSCRRSQIVHVLYHLLTNAADAVENNSEEQGKWIKIGFEDHEHHFCLKVSDNGPALTEEVKLRMMDPFFTTKEVGKGTGLGLSISRAIIEDHGGELYREDNSKQTCLIVKLKKS